MTTDDVREMVYEFMMIHGLTGWAFQFNDRKRTLGRCIYSKNRIELSLDLVHSGNLPEIRETILHEIAHALVGPGHAHDEVWKHKASEVGARPVACAEMGAVPDMGRGAKYRASCACPNPHFRYRAMRNQKARYKCRACATILEYVPIPKS